MTSRPRWADLEEKLAKNEGQASDSQNLCQETRFRKACKQPMSQRCNYAQALPTRLSCAAQRETRLPAHKVIY
jgi:hypothetical protein